MQRRDLLRYICAGFLNLILFGCKKPAEQPSAPAAKKPVKISLEEKLVQLVQTELDYLEHNLEALKKFPKDYIEGHKGLPINIVPEVVAKVYLYGSDFFKNGMDTSKMVQYQAIYDPYQQPCGNVFARL